MTKNENGKNIIAGAPLAMKDKGSKTDEMVLAEINKKPKITIHELAEKLGWSNGKVDGSVKRLTKGNKVKVQHLLKNGVLIKEVFPLDYIQKPKNLINIPTMFINKDIWDKKVNVYALNRSTIAFSPLDIEEWDVKALKKDKINAFNNDDELSFQIPEKITDFYLLNNSEISLSFNKNKAMLTIESTILPVDLPSNYKERKQESEFIFAFEQMKKEIEGVITRYTYTRGIAIRSKPEKVEYLSQTSQNQDVTSKRNLMGVFQGCTPIYTEITMKE
jgi:hypothetical protein